MGKQVGTGGFPAIEDDTPSMEEQFGEVPEYDDDFDDGDCWNCGGEGFVSSCFEEWACVDPESGCDLCTRRCDVCNPCRHIPRERT